jgi:hypothetical protein
MLQQTTMSIPTAKDRFVDTLRSSLDSKPPLQHRGGSDTAKNIDPISPAEIRRRALDVFDQACVQCDFNYLPGVVALSNCKTFNLESTSITFSSPDPATLKTLLHWSQEHYGDIMHGRSFQLVCRGTPSSLQISVTQQEFCRDLNIEPIHITRPVFMTNKMPDDPRKAAPMPYFGVIKVDGGAYVSLIGALLEYLRRKGETFRAEEEVKGKKLGARPAVNLYLASVMSKCRQQAG